MREGLARMGDASRCKQPARKRPAFCNVNVDLTEGLKLKLVR